MINLALPDKYIRKSLFDLINGIVVNSNEIKIYDTRITGASIPQHYVLMTTQTNSVDESVKCGYRWESSILLDIVTRYDSQGNTGSRLLADDITEAIRGLLENKLTLGGGLNVIKQDLDFPNDISTVTENEVIYRKLIRIELLIN